MGKKKKEKKKPMQVWKLYDSGKSRNNSCPKCGPGVFLAAHKDRETCGKCGYTIFKDKVSKEKKEVKEIKEKK